VRHLAAHNTPVILRKAPRAAVAESSVVAIGQYGLVFLDSAP